MAHSVEPNDYNLSGDDATVSYASTSFAGRPTFDYRTGQTHLQFSGDAVRSLDAEFGKLVTVTIATIEDAGTAATLTLLIPTLNLRSSEGKVDFKTVAIMTELRSGAPQHYKVLNLHGTARFTVF